MWFQCIFQEVTRELAVFNMFNAAVHCCVSQRFSQTVTKQLRFCIDIEVWGPPSPEGGHEERPRLPKDAQQEHNNGNVRQ